MMHFDDHGMGAAGWVLASLVLLLFWGAAVAVLVAVVRGLWNEPRHDPTADPLRLLDERFARGDLDEPEYLRRRELLAGGGRGARPQSR